MHFWSRYGPLKFVTSFFFVDVRTRICPPETLLGCLTLSAYLTSSFVSRYYLSDVNAPNSQRYRGRRYMAIFWSYRQITGAPWFFDRLMTQGQEKSKKLKIGSKLISHRQFFEGQVKNTFTSIQTTKTVNWRLFNSEYLANRR